MQTNKKYEQTHNTNKPKKQGDFVGLTFKEEPYIGQSN